MTIKMTMEMRNLPYKYACAVACVAKTNGGHIAASAIHLLYLFL